MVEDLETQAEQAQTQAELAQAQTELARSALGRAVCTILALRQLAVSPEIQTRIMSCPDIAHLERWLDRAATISSTEALFS